MPIDNKWSRLNDIPCPHSLLEIRSYCREELSWGIHTHFFHHFEEVVELAMDVSHDILWRWYLDDIGLLNEYLYNLFSQLIDFSFAQQFASLQFPQQFFHYHITLKPYWCNYFETIIILNELLRIQVQGIYFQYFPNLFIFLIFW